MKAKVSNKCSRIEEPVWCDHCHLRVAPYEESVTAGTKIFHTHCFVKDPDHTCVDAELSPAR